MSKAPLKTNKVLQGALALKPKAKQRQNNPNQRDKQPSNRNGDQEEQKYAKIWCKQLKDIKHKQDI